MSGAPAGFRRFRMREKLVSFGDDYRVEDDDGNAAFVVNGKAMRVRDTLDIEDLHGRTLLKLKTKVMHIHDTMDIDDPSGHRVARVQKAIITPLRERFTVDVEGGHELKAKGRITDHNYTIKSGNVEVATIDKKWFRIADTYGVEIADNADVPLILAVVVAIDEIAHPAK